MSHLLHLQFLGALDIQLNGESLSHFRSTKAQALLCYLAVTGRVHSRTVLSGLLWGDSPEEQARASLRQALANLTELCAECLTITRQSVAFNRECSFWLDTATFERAASHLMQDPGAVELHPDLNLYRGDFLEGFYVRNAPDFETWMLGVRARYRELALQAFVAVATYLMESGDLAQAILHSRRVLEIEPWHEGAHRQLMQLLAQTGQRTAALEQYRQCRRLLADELGVEPDEATQALYAEIKRKQSGAPLLARGVPTATAEPRNHLADPRQREQVERKHGSNDAKAAHDKPQGNLVIGKSNLPTSPTPFIGREKEMEAIQQRLNAPQCRLLTLAGPGGIGKTRLAVEVAAARRELYNDGVYFVNLQLTPSVEALPLTIANTLQIVMSGGESPQQQVRQYLADKSLLLVLDNFEHLLDGATMVAEVLAAAPNVQMVVTSRTVMNLREEWLFWVEGIAYPPALPLRSQEELTDYGAVQLFCEHVQRLQPTFQLGSYAASVVHICQLSEGMPLALELAASWAKSLSCVEIAEELANGLTILSTRLRNIPERHRTMRVVFEESWRRISEQEQAVFQQLSIFRGGFRREAAQQVAGATVHALSVLVDCSLLKQNADGRYHIHELLRQFGEERLAESPLLETATHQAHSAYFMTFLTERRFAFDGHGQFQAVQEIAREVENIRHAWQWAVKHLQAEAIRKAARSLFFFCQHRSCYLEGAEKFADTIRQLEGDDLQAEQGAALAECLTYYGWLCIRLSRLSAANAALARARQLYDTLGLLPPQYRAGDPITAMLILALVQGDYDQALALGEQARQQAEQHEQPAALAFACFGLANTYLAQGHYAQARMYGEQGVALNESMGNRWLSSYCHDILGQIAYRQQELDAAKNHFQASYVIREEFEDAGGMAAMLNHLGKVALAEEQPQVAQQHYERSQALYRDINDQGGWAVAIKGMGDVAYRLGEYPLAEAYFQQALRVALEIHYMPLVFEVLLASSDLFLQTDQRLLGIEVLAFVYHHAASDYTCKAQARQMLEVLHEDPAAMAQKATWQNAPGQWAALLRSV